MSDDTRTRGVESQPHDAEGDGAPRWWAPLLPVAVCVATFVVAVALGLLF